jgi:hypothetical protein
MAQLTMFKDPGPTGTFRVQNLMAGGQAAWVIPWGPSAQRVLGQQTSVFLDPDHHVLLGLRFTVTSTFTAPPKARTGHAIRDRPGVTLDWSGGLVFGGQF